MEGKEAVRLASEGATDDGAPGPASAGERFARALAAKDAEALCALLADQVDFQALTSGRHWQAGCGCAAPAVTIWSSSRPTTSPTARASRGCGSCARGISRSRSEHAVGPVVDQPVAGGELRQDNVFRYVLSAKG